MSGSRFNTIWMLVCAFFSTNGARTEEMHEPIPWSLRDVTQYHQLQVESGIKGRESGFQYVESRLKSEFTSQLTPHLKGVLSTRVLVDAKDKLIPGRMNQSTSSRFSRNLLIGDHGELGVREFYLRYQHPGFELTMGKQRVVWGQSDGLKLLDMVNPMDFTKFILEDFSESSIPLWSVNLEVPLSTLQGGKDDAFDDSMSSFQFIWIPDQTYHRIPDLDAAYGFSSPLFVPQVPSWVAVSVMDAERPNRFFADSDVGVRYAVFLNQWDFSLNYMLHYDDIPALTRRVTFLNGRITGVVTPTYVRSHVIGMSASTTFGNWTFRSESVGFLDRPFPTSSLIDRDGVVRADELGQMLGFDYFGLRDTVLSFQLFQSWLVRDQPLLYRDTGEFNMTQHIRHNLLDGRLGFEFTWLLNPVRGDGLLRPGVEYEFNDHWVGWIGANWFYGDRQGMFGQFEDQSHVVTRLMFYF